MSDKDFSKKRVPTTYDFSQNKKSITIAAFNIFKIAVISHRSVNVILRISISV